MTDRPTADRLRLGVSDCLMGRLVRHDGGHKHDRYLTDTLGQWVDWVPVCPEVEIGLGTPRPAMRLIASGPGPQLIVRSTGEDLTERMNTWSRQWVAGAHDLEGFILKKDSPSCGMERVRLYPPEEGAQATRTGVGLFAQVLIEDMAHLPIEEEGRLNDPVLREHFFERVFAHRRWRRFRATRPRLGDLVAFHASAKMALLSHHERRYRELGRIVAGGKAAGLTQTLDDYEATYFDIYRHRATRRRHTNVLQHLAGHVKREIDADDRAELSGLIDQYHGGSVPLIVPVTLLRHHSRRVGSDWLRSQTYLDPYPDELMLRNHV